MAFVDFDFSKHPCFPRRRSTRQHCRFLEPSWRLSVVIGHQTRVVDWVWVCSVAYPWLGWFHRCPHRINDNGSVWKHGTGENASDNRLIIGSMFLSATTENGHALYISSLVLEGSSQGVIGRKVCAKFNIFYDQCNSLFMPFTDRKHYFTLFSSPDMYCLLPRCSFDQRASGTHSLTTFLC